MSTPIATSLLAIAGALLVATAPAIAAPQPGGDPAPATESPAPKAPDASADRKRYCVVEAFTGSRIKRKTCHTKSEWAAQGVDVTAK